MGDADAQSHSAFELSTTHCAFGPFWLIVRLVAAFLSQMPVLWSTATQVPANRLRGLAHVRHELGPAPKHVEHTGSQAAQAPFEANCPAGHVVKVELPFGRKGAGSQAWGFEEET
jgi:hypothetical protein